MLISLLLGCTPAGDEEVGNAAATRSALIVKEDVFVNYLKQEYTCCDGDCRYRVNSCEYELRANGAYLAPSERVAVAAIDHDPYPYGGRRLQLHVIDLHIGDVVEQYPIAYAGSDNLKGVAATSWRDNFDSVHGMLVVADDGPQSRGFLSIVLDGTYQGHDRPVVPILITGINYDEADLRVVPALEFGVVNEQGRIFMAYAVQKDGPPEIAVGFLKPSGFPGVFEFEQTGSMQAGPDGECGRVYQNIDAAFDTNRNEFGIAWMCEADPEHPTLQWGAYIARVSGDGEPRTSVPFAEHPGVDGKHSSSTLSYNQFTDRYFHTFQHNAAAPFPDGDSFDCERTVTGQCLAPTACIVNTQVFAAEVDYRDGLEFRMGGACQPGGNCPYSTEDGISAELVAGENGNSCGAGFSWSIEEGLLWSGRPSEDASSLHQYIRAPGSGVTVALNIWPRSDDLWGHLRFTLIDEEFGVPFDE